MQFMRHRNSSRARQLCIVWASLIFLTGPDAKAVQPTPAALSAFNAHVADVESRLSRQHRSGRDFLFFKDAERLRNGELIIDRLTPSNGADLPDAMLHQWRGTAFAPGATAADFERLMRDVDAYPRCYAPQILSARVIEQRGDQFRAVMRIRQKHVITVVMDTTYDVLFARLDARHGYSIARSMRISEIDSPGTAHERVLSPGEENGFLWKLNTYWSYEERDDGLYIQVESISLTRSIPTGLAWAIGPFVESLPRESLEFTLLATRDALQKHGSGQ
jgi:hypothetical protein